MSLANGEFIVIAAGDDISLADRTRILVEHWLAEDKIYDSLYSSAIKMDENGKEYEIFFPSGCHDMKTPISIAMRKTTVLGATHAYTRRVWDMFGDISSKVTNEDKVIGFRSSLLGGCLFINEPLVKYRDGGESGTLGKPLRAFHRDGMLRYMRNLLVLKQHVSDLEKVKVKDDLLYSYLTKAIMEHELLTAIQKSQHPLFTLLLNAKRATPFVCWHAIKVSSPFLYLIYAFMRQKIALLFKLRKV